MNVVRYVLEIDLSVDGGPVFSRTEIEFERGDGSEVVQANLDVAAIRSMSLNGHDLPTAMFRPADGALRLTDLEAINVLAVEAELSFGSDGHGLVAHVDPDGSRYVHVKLNRNRQRDGRRPITAAASVFPCFDGWEQASFDLRVVVPLGWSVLSYGRPVDQPAEGAAGRWRFESEGVWFVAGPWARVSSPRANQHTGTPLYGRRAVASKLTASPVGHLVEECDASHAAALGVPNPFPVHPMVFIPAYASLGGGGSVMAFHESMLDASLEPAEQRYVLWALAHETAHSWFGSHLSRSSTERWLMEGIATFMGHYAMAVVAPEFHPWAAFHVIEEASAHAADVADDAVPIRSATSSPLVYSKPAAVLRHLSSVVGETQVVSALGLWVQRCRDVDSTSSDLLEALAEVTDIDVEAWAEEWIRTPGVNTLELLVEVSENGTVGSARVMQLPGQGSPILRTHHTGLETYDLSPAGHLQQRDRLSLVVSGQETDVPELVGHPEPALMVLNSPATTYARVRLGERSRLTLADHLSNLSVETRSVCWVAARGMVHDRAMPLDELAGWIERHGDAEPDAVVADMLTARRPRIGLFPGWETWKSMANS